MPQLPIHEVLARRLKAARVAEGVSQADLGVRMGLSEDVSSTRINRYENAVHAPSLEAAEQLAEALGLPLPALLCRDDRLAEVIAGFELLTKKQQAAILGQIQDALGEERANDVRQKVWQGAENAKTRARTKIP